MDTSPLLSKLAENDNRNEDDVVEIKYRVPSCRAPVLVLVVNLESVLLQRMLSDTQILSASRSVTTPAATTGPVRLSCIANQLRTIGGICDTRSVAEVRSCFFRLD